MAATVQVVLREDMDKLGKTGELVKVKRGYARNYLIPRGLAALATKGNVEQIEHERKAALARSAKLRQSAEALAQQIAEVGLEIAKPSGEEGRLYGAVTVREIAALLAEKGVTVDRKKIQLSEPIKQLGEHQIKVKLAPEVAATIRLNVVTQS